MKDLYYGSGSFGYWSRDELGLPAYIYTCDQFTENQAVTPCNQLWRNNRDHFHQIGNFRFNAIASNFGYVQIRQDEGGVKLLNDYKPEDNSFGGGIGYLSDGKEKLSTLYSEANKELERIFGCGYFKKQIVSSNFAVEQVIFAPYGDEPFLISQVTIRNLQDEEVSVEWSELWDCSTYQISFRSVLESMLLQDIHKIPEIRRDFSRKFQHNFEVIENSRGILDTLKFNGWTDAECAQWDNAKAVIESIKSGLFGGKIYSEIPNVSFYDYSPPPIFLIALDGSADELDTPDNKSIKMKRNIVLRPKEIKTIYNAFGYIPPDKHIADIFDLIESKYKNPQNIFEETCISWKKNNAVLSVPDEPWIQRELEWNNYYLKSNTTFDSYFDEHVISQGSGYQYLMGINAAPRDQVQHSLPLIYSEPWLVKENIRYILKESLPNGEIPFGITGNGMMAPTPIKSSDFQLWIIWLISEYVLATRDKGFLEEELRVYPIDGKVQNLEKIETILERMYVYQFQEIGYGEHGLLRLLKGDWNDLIVQGFVPPDMHDVIDAEAESILNSAMAAYVLHIYSRLQEYIGNKKKALLLSDEADNLRKAVQSQWNGKWFRRAWLTDEIGWVGDNELWLEPQPWAVVGRCADAGQADILTKNIEKFLREPSPIGAFLIDKPVAPEPGEMTNGGVWPSVNGILCWALSMIDPNRAWNEWEKNLLSAHAEAYPDIWYGIWSGPDYYNSIQAKYPGHTFFDKSIIDGGPPAPVMPNWTDFPVMCMHSHAWSLYSATKLMGIEFSDTGVMFCPSIPKDEYSFKSPLLEFSKTKEGYTGSYKPLQEGDWTITLTLPEQELKTINSIEINGEKEISADILKDKIIFSGESFIDAPLTWKIKK